MVTAEGGADRGVERPAQTGRGATAYQAGWMDEPG